jgi:hypothetical protein
MWIGVVGICSIEVW